MDQVPPTFRHSPDEAIRALQAFEGPVLIDLDETLYLRNSTEDFIDSACPAAVALVLLKLLDVLRPWRWTGPETRDVWRLRAITVLLPWAWIVWAHRVRKLATLANQPLLLAATARRTPPIVATLGFRSVVRPLISAMGLPDAQIVASRVWHAQDRKKGKLFTTRLAVGEEIISQSLVVTDSIQDSALLEACKKPILTTWPGAKFRPAFASAYVPGRYLVQVKRPKQGILRTILLDDFALWVLCSIWISPNILTIIPGLFFLLISFWTIYEQGYAGNDRSAALYESDPHLSQTFATSELETPLVLPWIWAAAFGYIGLDLINIVVVPSVSQAASWTLILVATATIFRLFNRFDKSTRAWFYIALQLARYGAFAAMVEVVPFAPIVIAAFVAERWIPYYVYRFLKSSDTSIWWRLPLKLIRLVFALAFTGVELLSSGISNYLTWSTLGLLVFIFAKARKQLLTALKQATRIDR